MLDAASAAGVVEKSSAEIGVAMSNYLFISPFLKQSSYLCKLHAIADTQTRCYKQHIIHPQRLKPQCKTIGQSVDPKRLCDIKDSDSGHYCNQPLRRDT